MHYASFDPRTVAEEHANLAREYGCSKIIGDNFSGEWVSAAFREAGVQYETSPLRKSDLYLEALPAFNRGAVLSLTMSVYCASCVDWNAAFIALAGTAWTTALRFRRLCQRTLRSALHRASRDA